jgi:type II secretory pathway predicted ATPase ExeA
MSGKDAVTELREHAQWLRDMMAATRTSLNKAVRDWDLGSKRTFARILDGQMEEADAAEWLERYRAARERLENEEGKEPVYALPTYEAVTDAVLSAFRPGVSTGRVVFVIGAPGIGKTTTVMALARKYGQRIVRIEAHELWGDSPSNMLEDLLAALGINDAPVSGAARMKEAVRALRGFRRCLVIDEAHHVGPRILNTIKSLVNMTPGEFVLTATPPMWTKLNKGAFAEASQLYTNRLGAFVLLELLDGDVERYLLERFKGRISKGEAAAAARVLRPVAERNGCYAFLRDVCRELERAGNGFGADAISEATREVRDNRPPM